MRQSLAEILRAAEIFRLPVSGEITVPKLQDTFWTLLIGKGYPTPNRSMRWCTDRLKIQPTSGYILQKVNENGKASSCWACAKTNLPPAKQVSKATKTWKTAI